MPFITDSNNFVLSESNAILKYICNKHPSVPSHYWPSDKKQHFWPADIKQRALIDQFLEYYQQSFRPALVTPVRIRQAKVLLGRPFDEQAWSESLAALWAQLDIFEVMLKMHEGRYVVGD